MEFRENDVAAWVKQLADHLLRAYGGSDNHNQAYTIMGLELEPCAETAAVRQANEECARPTLSQDPHPLEDGAAATAESGTHAASAAATANFQVSTLSRPSKQQQLGKGSEERKRTGDDGFYLRSL